MPFVSDWFLISFHGSIAISFMDSILPRTWVSRACFPSFLIHIQPCSMKLHSVVWSTLKPLLAQRKLPKLCLAFVWNDCHGIVGRIDTYWCDEPVVLPKGVWESITSNFVAPQFGRCVLLPFPSVDFVTTFYIGWYFLCAYLPSFQCCWTLLANKTAGLFDTILLCQATTGGHLQKPPCI